MPSIDPKLLKPGSTVIFYSTSPDKIENYRQIFQHYNVNFFTLDELGIPPTKTPEDNSNYSDHVQEKGHELVHILAGQSSNSSSTTVLQDIKHALQERGIDESRIVGMVEDSGLSIVAQTQAEKQAVQYMKDELRRRIILSDDPKKGNYERLFRGFDNNVTGFPGPDLKLIVEALSGGIFELVKIIHLGQEKAGLDYLRYQNETSVALVDTKKSAVSSTYSTEAEGQFTTPSQWNNTLAEQRKNPGMSVTYDNMFLPRTKDGALVSDVKNNFKTRAQMIKDQTLFQPDSPINDYRTQNIQNIGFPVGTQNKFLNPIPMQVGYLHGDLFHGKTPKKNPKLIPKVNNTGLVRLPTIDEMLLNPNLEALASVNCAILRPSTVNHKKINRLTKDKAYQLQQATKFDGVNDLTNEYSVAAETLQSEIFEEQRLPLENNVQILLLAAVSKLIHPRSKNTGIIVDNRDGHFDAALKLFDETYWNGLAQGTSPIQIAETNKQLFALQQEAAERFKFALNDSSLNMAYNPEPELKNDKILNFELPQDRFSVFVGGGAFNNSPSYTRQTGNISQYIASNDWTLVTGGGQLEGPMGAAHAGFLEYYLSRDKLEKILKDDCLSDSEKDTLQSYIITREAPILEDDTVPFKAVNVEKMLKENEELLYKIADNDAYVPKDRFFAFSMEYLIKQEGAGKPPAGTREDENYFESGNIIRRMHAMLKAKTHVYAPGAHGTAQELIQSLIQNRAEKDINKRKDIIIYNKIDETTNRGVFDHVIDQLNLNDPAVRHNRKVTIVTRYEDLQSAIENSQKQWEEKHSLPMPGVLSR